MKLVWRQRHLARQLEGEQIILSLRGGGAGVLEERDQGMEFRDPQIFILLLEHILLSGQSLPPQM